MRRVGVAAELELLGAYDLENLLESGTEFHKCVLTTCLACCPCPQSDSVEALANVDYDTHHLVVTIILKCLADSR